MNSKQFIKWLQDQGCTFEVKRGKGGHIIARNGNKMAVIPSHGGRKQLKTGTMQVIKKQLGLI